MERKRGGVVPLRQSNSRFNLKMLFKCTGIAAYIIGAVSFSTAGYTTLIAGKDEECVSIISIMVSYK